MKQIVAIAVALLCNSVRAAAPATRPATNPAPNDVSALLAPIIQKHDVPGMAAAVVSKGDIVALGVAGVHTRGKPEKIAITDRFHLGSDTKAFTAMLCGILVDEGKLKWSQTLGETFPELKKTMDPQWQAVTLEQLLHHRGGAPGDLAKDELWAKLWQHKGTPTSARRALLLGVTSKPPEAPPGTKFIYSNAGYAIAGHMAEKVTGKSWEDLVREKIFRPLGMSTAGFGPPGTKAKNDQPRGHKADGTPVEPGPEADNPVAIGPAGIIHCCIADWAKFAIANLPSAKIKLVKPETLEKLHTPVPPGAGEQPYAMGWIVADNQPWAGGPALTHAGSNTMWMAVAWLAPGKDFAVLVACNQANAEACNDAALALIADHFKDERQPSVNPKLSPKAPKDKPFDMGPVDAGEFKKAIAAYVEKARKTYPDAKKRYLAGLPEGQHFFVVTKLTDEGGKFEQVFIAVRRIEGDRITCRIANEIRVVQGFKNGDAYTFPESELIDWLITLPNGTEEGNVVGKYLDEWQEKQKK
jgi:CubicO group peptidase (beta-lactamase class C family)